MAWMEAPYLTSSSITFTRFFLQAMCSGVKPFCGANTVNRDLQVHVDRLGSFFHSWVHVFFLTYQCPGVRVGPFVQQQFGDSVVTAVSRHVQRCQVVQRDVINRSLVLQKVFDALNVVTLCCHVQRGQPVLWEGTVGSAESCR